MKNRTNFRPLLLLLSVLSVIFLSSIALGQTDININDRDLVRIGGDVIVPAGKVVDNARAIGGDVSIEKGARVRETAIAIGGDVILGEKARVDGDAYSIGGDIVRGAGASIGGASRVFTEQGRWDMHGSRQRGMDGFLFHYLLGLASHLLIVLVSGIVGVLLLRWRPRFLLDLADTVRQYPIESILAGLGGIVAVIMLAILLAISLIGIPLLPLLGLSFIGVMLLGTLGVALWIGERAWTKPDSTIVRQFLVGLLILALIGLVPGAGGLVLSAVNLVGFGAVIIWALNRQRPPIDRVDRGSIEGDR
ncbi:hypothetical protein V0288_00900 [Pannus brasiliensis CCIBt3594]|uniref:DUF8173 domain-containing protein n=1 Tax=Pannus brasiliensis CCIBt3594 TaxID=1427578 RepID=A0AAW9QQE2_9CHRO